MAFARVGVEALAEAEAELLRRRSYKMKRYFPDEGPYRRELYPKALMFFAAGTIHRERAMIAANRIGKSEAGSYEVTCHLTGEYPHWWVGKRWSHPVRCWACGTTNEKTKEIVQAKLIGQEKMRGTGMIPGHLLHDIQTKGNGVIESVWVRHVSGGISELKFKSYEMGRKAFEGTEQHLLWLDDEPPEDVYVECLLRTMATGAEFTGGLILMTFTPLQGSTTVVNRFMKEGVIPHDGIVPDEPEGEDPFLKKGEF
jgi:phage terminase large subunit-like protein